jgi:hypothetical protein
MWNRLSRDYEVDLNIQDSLNAMKKLPANGSIFVFHDSEKAFKNLQVLLPQLLKFYKNEVEISSYCGTDKKIIQEALANMTSQTPIYI